MAPVGSMATSRPRSLRHATLLGIGLMSLGIFAYSLNDTLGKWLVATYSVPQVMLIRGLFALAVLSPLLWRERRTLMNGIDRPLMQAVRALAVVLDVGLFYVAVVYLPLANVMTWYLAGPIYVTALSPLLLGESVGWRRWLAVIAGFAGVVIALAPTKAGLGLPELAAFGGSLAFAIVMITTRRLRGSSETVLIATQVAAPLLAGLVAAPFLWTTPSGVDFVLLGLLGIVSMVAGVCVNRALKLAPASVVVPYQYAFIVWAIVFGYLFFGDVPQPHMLVGAAIIIAAGLFIFLREQRLAEATQPVLPAAKSDPM